MKYHNYRYYIDNAMEVLNGKVNKLLNCHKHYYVYNEGPYASAYNGVVKINLQSMGFALKDASSETKFARIISTISHELSHLDQDINYFRYEKDYSYRAWVEKSNELNSICFIMDNIKYLQQELGPFNQSIFEDLYMYAKRYGTNYVPATRSSLVANIIELYLIDINKTRYKDMTNIIMNIDGIKYMVKSNGNIIDPNVLYPVVEDLSNFNELRVFNSIGNDTLTISVRADSEQRKLQEIAHRIDTRYIIA